MILLSRNEKTLQDSLESCRAFTLVGEKDKIEKWNHCIFSYTSYSVFSTLKKARLHQMIKKLIVVAPPPETLQRVENSKRIMEVENMIGSSLPPDYIEYISTYGECMWYDHIFISSPFRGDEYSLWGWHQQNHSHLCDLFKSDYSFEKYPVYPEPGGIFLCGGDAFGEFIAWITEGSPDQWPVAYFNMDCGIFNRFELNITDFLFKIITGEIEPNCFPKSIRDSFINKPIATAING